MENSSPLKQSLEKKDNISQPQKDTSNKKNPLLIIFVIALFLALTGIVGYTAYHLGKKAGDDTNKDKNTAETQNEKSNEDDNESLPNYSGWETCSNKEWGFSIKHPSDWKCTQATESGHDRHYLVLEKEDKEITLLSQYSFSPSEDGGCRTDPIDITTLSIADKNYDIQYCKESSLPQIFNQITYNFKTSPPEIFYIVGTGFKEVSDEELDTLELIFQSIKIDYKGYDNSTMLIENMKVPVNWTAKEEDVDNEFDQDIYGEVQKIVHFHNDQKENVLNVYYSFYPRELDKWCKSVVSEEAIVKEVENFEDISSCSLDSEDKYYIYSAVPAIDVYITFEFSIDKIEKQTFEDIYESIEFEKVLP